MPQIASNIRSIEIDSSIWLESMKLHQSFATSSVNWKHPVEIATVNEVSVLKGRGEASWVETRDIVERADILVSCEMENEINEKEKNDI